MRRHREGALLVLGQAGSGKSEALAQRLAAITREQGGASTAMVITSTEIAARRIGERAAQLVDGDYEELLAGTWQTVGERLLREYATEAGIDPFFEVIGPAERLAILLDRLEELPLRLHEIRGNPSGLLARILHRIDRLKTDAITAEELAEQARDLGAEAGDEAARESAARELEFAELYAAHDRILAAGGSLCQGDIPLLAHRMLTARADVRERITDRYRHLMIDELEDLTPAQWALLADLGPAFTSLTATFDADHSEEGEQSDPANWFTELHAGAERIELDTGFRAATRVRFWRAANERAQAQAAAREIEQLLGAGTGPERICILIADPARRGAAVGAALEERSVPFRLADSAALFRRPEVRDTVAWLRSLADPGDSPATARALTRPPVQLSSADLARLTTIARRRKLSLVDACQAALESPQFNPEARERLQSFLRLHRAATAAMEERRADVFVRRLIERVGVRRERMFAAQAEVAERLISLAQLAELAAAWSRREPHGTTRDFVRQLSAIADSGIELGVEPNAPSPGSVTIMSLERAKGHEFSHVFALGLEDTGQAPDRALRTVMSRASEGLVLAWAGSEGDATTRPAPAYVQAKSLLDGEEEVHEEELFGPGESMHATYRVLREDVLETSWATGRQLNEPRLDTAVDLNRAVTRYLELLKLAAVAQRPDDSKPEEVIAAVNGILRQIATPEQLADLEASALDSYLLEEANDRDRRRGLIAARQEPSLEAFLPRRGEGLRLSATDLDLYLTCPLKYKFARVFALPQAPTINQRFGILIHSVLDRFHRDSTPAETAEPSALARLSALFESGWRRSGFGTSEDELQFRNRAREAIRLYWEREREAEGEPVWLEKSFEFRIGPHHLRGRVDRVDRLPSGEHELIDYKTGIRRSRGELLEDLQLSLYRMAASKAWGIEASIGSYYYVLDAEKVRVEPQPEDAERVERTVLTVGEGVMSQDFEPRPSAGVCSWCDYRLICPAAE